MKKDGTKSSKIYSDRINAANNRWLNQKQKKKKKNGPQPIVMGKRRDSY